MNAPIALGSQAQTLIICFDFQGGRKSLADEFEYVMNGKLYRISEEGSGANLKA